MVLWLSFIGLVACQVAADEKATQRDLTGEWAVEWFDKKSDYRETIFIDIKHKDDAIAGTGLDSDLITSVIDGTVKSDEVEFSCKPSRHPLPFKSPPFSTFKGKCPADDAMEGTWELDRRESPFSRRPNGTWTAKRTRVDGKSTVTMTRETEIIVRTTSAEYDLLCHLGATPTKYEQEMKQSRRRGDEYEVKTTPVSLLDSYAIEMQLAKLETRIKPDSAKLRLGLCAKIESALHQSGYPWKLDENSRTLLVPK
jgi:hypothetical protein